MLSHQQARIFYNRFGSRQDAQSFYEDPATQDLIAHADLMHVARVCEFGCGTGRFAARLLDKHLPRQTLYYGIDQSTTMARLANQRLARFEARTAILLSDGTPRVPLADQSMDRFISTYVLDLLPEQEIYTLLQEAQRVLRPGGRLCLVSLTYGRSPFARLITWAWQRLHGHYPLLVGGCRPIELAKFLSASAWRLDHLHTVTTWGMASEVVVATPQ